MKRTNPAILLRRSPLVYVLAQIRFSAIVKIEKFIPDIQETLRHKGFPKFGQGHVSELTFEPNSDPKLTKIDRWEFQNRDGSLGFLLTPGFLVIHTSKYSTFEEFESNIRTGLNVLNDIAMPSLVERVGLRYVDLIQPRPEEGFEVYLKSGLLGLEEKEFGSRNSFHRYEFSGQTDLGRLVIRWSQNADSVYLPPDLSPSTLIHNVNITRGSVVGLLDLDHFTVTTSDFDPESIITNLQSLHDNLDRAFRAAVTPKALEIWEIVK